MRGAHYRALLDTIDKLYAAALEPARWERFLGAAVELFEADHAFVCQAENRRRPFDYIGLNRFNRAALPLARYEMDRDPRRRAFNASNGRAVHCRMASSHHELRGSRVYREYLQPLDIEYTMVISLPTQPGFTHDLGLTRGRSGRAFDSNDCDLLNELAPHLSRSFGVMRAIREAGRAHSREQAAAPPPPLDVESLRRRFGLAPAQARLTALICNGQTVREAAARLGITEGTARQYLLLIFDKTGVRRQADLIRLVGPFSNAE